jgi:hypothetical protein
MTSEIPYLLDCKLAFADSKHLSRKGRPFTMVNGNLKCCLFNGALITKRQVADLLGSRVL